MRDGVRIQLSVGLVAVAAVHAAILGLVLTALPCKTPVTTCCERWDVPARPATVEPTVGAIEKLPEPQRVNLEAQGELKQQRIGGALRRVVVRRVASQPAVDCTPQPTASVPVVTPVKITAATPPVGTRGAAKPGASAKPATEKAPADPRGASKQTAPAKPASGPATPPPKKNYQIALFVGDDARSQQLQEWFDEHPDLARLRSSSEYQVYTASNAIYRTRFADIVPVEQFPVVLFQDATGGHIHAAGRSMIPSTPDELYSDLRQGYELYQQAKEAEKTGAVRSRGYSWDDDISPTLYLSADDCPDGYCPVEPADTWRPGDRVRDGLFDEARDTRDALLWVSAGEIATVALIVLAVILLGFILIKRGM